MSSLADRLRTWRRRLKAGLPYVRRREHRVLEQKYATLIEALDGGAAAAADAALHWLRPLPPGLGGEVCLFVTHAAEAPVKAHALGHVAALAGAGIRVVVVVNTDRPAAAFTDQRALFEHASAVAVRANTGYDFGAWAHVLALGEPARWERLYLVNDSIVGPLDRNAFATLLDRIRRSSADVVGLTEGLAPVRHLQSYFLVFGVRALRSAAFRRLFERVRNWPLKGQVIDLYEARMTRLLEADGLRCEALFPSLRGDALSADDTSLRWAELVGQGFPYLKTRVVAAHADDPRIAAWLAALPAPDRR